MKQKKKKLNIQKILFFILFIISAVYCINRYTVICVWNKPTDNRWTTASHYMALLATDCKNMVYVSNPNGLENNSKSSGWYNINEITPYLAKALYIEEY